MKQFALALALCMSACVTDPTDAVTDDDATEQDDDADGLVPQKPDVDKHPTGDASSCHLRNRAPNCQS